MGGGVHFSRRSQMQIAPSRAPVAKRSAIVNKLALITNFDLRLQLLQSPTLTLGPDARVTAI